MQFPCRRYTCPANRLFLRKCRRPTLSPRVSRYARLHLQARRSVLRVCAQMIRICLTRQEMILQEHACCSHEFSLPRTLNTQAYGHLAHTSECRTLFAAVLAVLPRLVMRICGAVLFRCSNDPLDMLLVVDKALERDPASDMDVGARIPVLTPLASC